MGATMRKGWSLTIAALVAGLVLVSLGIGTASACTFANGHESFQYDILAHAYAAREGSMKMGEQATFTIRGGVVDVYVFNEAQYYSYVNLGQYEDGWSGVAAYKEFEVSSTSFVFTAPAEGNYFLVVDNTVAGSDPGNLGKNMTVDIFYPFGESENDPVPFLPIVLAGMVCFTLLVLVVFERK